MGPTSGATFGLSRHSIAVEQLRVSQFTAHSSEALSLLSNAAPDLFTNFDEAGAPLSAQP
jgi:hypothetical protein